MFFTNEIHKEELAHKDAKFINLLYYTPVGMLIQMEKAYLRHCIARLKLLSHWLEGILELTTELDRKGD
jgi:hypothetical protein